MKAVRADDLEAHRKSSYPTMFAERMGDRESRRLGDAFGLTQFGVNLTTLGPGGQSSLRHWHDREDELIYVVEGELVLVTDDGEQVMRAGDVVGFPGGSTDAHHLLNRSGARARYLVVGSRIEEDMAYYPDDDLKWNRDGERWYTTHKDGTPY